MQKVKFLTLFDDASKSVLTEKICKKYNIKAYPTSYIYNNLRYYDTLNSDSSLCSEHRCDSEFSYRGVPAGVFSNEFERAADEGVQNIVVVAPNSRWSTFEKNASCAFKNYSRCTDYNKHDINIGIVNSTAFASGTSLFTLMLAKKCSSFIKMKDFLNFAKSKAQEISTIAYTDSKVLFSDNVNDMFVINGHCFKAICLKEKSKATDILFSEKSARFITKNNRAYSVSFGCDCENAQKILSNIINLTDKHPVTISQYSIPGTFLFGTSGFVVHLF